MSAQNPQTMRLGPFGIRCGRCPKYVRNVANRMTSFTANTSFVYSGRIHLRIAPSMMMAARKSPLSTCSISIPDYVVTHSVSVGGVLAEHSRTQPRGKRRDPRDGNVPQARFAPAADFPRRTAG